MDTLGDEGDVRLVFPGDSKHSTKNTITKISKEKNGPN